jgi:hypothetical protein
LNKRPMVVNSLRGQTMADDPDEEKRWEIAKLDSGRAVPEGPMKRLLRIAAVAHLLLSSGFSDAYAADPYDGNWTGSATSTGRRCRPARVTLSVEGRVVTGQARFEGDAPNIHGTVLEDGALGATIGFQHLTGKFTQDEFEGTFKSSDCVWKMLLKRTK